MLLSLLFLLCACGHEPPTPSVTTTSPNAKVCTVSIRCDTILDHMADLNEAKKAFVPEDGLLLTDVPMEIFAGDTVYTILRRACDEHACQADCDFRKSGIQMEASQTPGFGMDAYYVQGIHQLYEKDCGPRSGWMFLVNGQIPDVGAGMYSVQDGDKIQWVYTCNWGEDIQ